MLKWRCLSRALWYPGTSVDEEGEKGRREDRRGRVKMRRQREKEEREGGREESGRQRMQQSVVLHSLPV